MGIIRDFREPLALALGDYVKTSKTYVHKQQFLHVVSPLRILNLGLEVLYILLQLFIVVVFKPVRLPTLVEREHNSHLPPGSSKAFRTFERTPRTYRRGRCRTNWRIIGSVCHLYNPSCKHGLTCLQARYRAWL
jgi:hypothetical protein